MNSTKLVVALTALNVAAAGASVTMVFFAKFERREAEARMIAIEKVCKSASEDALKAYMSASSEANRAMIENMKAKAERRLSEASGMGLMPAEREKAKGKERRTK